MVLSCHFENEAFVCEAVDLIAQKYGEQAKILIANWWDPMPAEIIDKVFDEVPFSRAGLLSTQLLRKPL